MPRPRGTSGSWLGIGTPYGTQTVNSGVSFQWLRVETYPFKMPGWTYVPRRVKVRASFVDNLGNRESRSSPPIWAPRPPNNAATGSPGITGAVQVGQTLSADTSGQRH